MKLNIPISGTGNERYVLNHRCVIIQKGILEYIACLDSMLQRAFFIWHRYTRLECLPAIYPTTIKKMNMRYNMINILQNTDKRTPHSSFTNHITHLSFIQVISSAEENYVWMWPPPPPPPPPWPFLITNHYSDAIMRAMASQIISLTIVYLTVHSGADLVKHQSSASLAFVWGNLGDRWIPRTNDAPTIWTNDYIFINWNLRNTFQWNSIRNQRFSFKNIHIKTSSAKWWPYCLGLNVLTPPSPNATYMRQWIGPALVHILACRLFGSKPLSKPMVGYCQLNP